tara:strand:+ start:40090 stop:41262 length:1173 start_codon:yes stop_codon:yes gene_type:complete
MKVLTLSSLYPNKIFPGRGSFIENKILNLKNHYNIDHRVVSPVPHIPLVGRFMPAQKNFELIDDRETRNGIEVIYPKYLHIPGLTMNIGPRNIYRACRPAIQQLIDDGFDFDIIDAHYAYPDGVAAYYLAKEFGKPFIVTALGTDINILPNYKKPRGLIIETLANADGVVAVSKDLCKKMIELGASKDKTTPIYNGVDLNLFAPTDKQEACVKIGASKNVLLSIGNLISLKGFDLIIKAMTNLEDAELYIVGSGPEEANLKSLISELGLENRVKLVGRLPQSELATYYNAADIFVLASSHEGMANVLLESLACGTPVVATPIAGMEEVIATDQVGVIMPDRSVEAIVSSVRSLLDNIPDRANVREYAEQFSWKTTSKLQIELFEKILNSE